MIRRSHKLLGAGAELIGDHTQGTDGVTLHQIKQHVSKQQQQQRGNRDHGYGSGNVVIGKLLIGNNFLADDLNKSLVFPLMEVKACPKHLVILESRFAIASIDCRQQCGVH